MDKKIYKNGKILYIIDGKEFFTLEDAGKYLIYTCSFTLPEAVKYIKSLELVYWFIPFALLISV